MNLPFLFIVIIYELYRNWIDLTLLLVLYGVSKLFGSFNAKESNFDKSFKRFSLLWVDFLFTYSKMSKQFYFKQFNIT